MGASETSPDSTLDWQMWQDHLPKTRSRKLDSLTTGKKDELSTEATTGVFWALTIIVIVPTMGLILQCSVVDPKLDVQAVHRLNAIQLLVAPHSQIRIDQCKVVHTRLGKEQGEKGMVIENYLNPRSSYLAKIWGRGTNSYWNPSKHRTIVGIQIWHTEGNWGIAKTIRASPGHLTLSSGVVGVHAEQVAHQSGAQGKWRQRNALIGQMRTTHSTRMCRRLYHI